MRTAIYHAPHGDNKVCEMGGHTFFDGKPEELNSDDDGYLIRKLENNPHFELSADDGQTKKRGRPSNAEKAARAQAEADAPAPKPASPIILA